MTWQPGDPVYAQPGLHVRRLIDFIPFLDGWADAAKWPVPIAAHDLDRNILPGRAP